VHGVRRERINTSLRKLRVLFKSIVVESLRFLIINGFICTDIVFATQAQRMYDGGDLLERLIAADDEVEVCC
jgi:hypothetical protein